MPGKKHIFTKFGKSSRADPANDLFLKWNSDEDLLSSSKSSATFDIAGSSNNKSTMRKGLSQSFKCKTDYTGKSITFKVYDRNQFSSQFKILSGRCSTWGYIEIWDRESRLFNHYTKESFSFCKYVNNFQPSVVMSSFGVTFSYRKTLMFVLKIYLKIKVISIVCIKTLFVNF